MEIICFCKYQFNKDQFKSHILKCDKFKEKFDYFDYIMAQLLKYYINSLNDALMVKIILQYYLKAIEKKIKKIPNTFNQIINNDDKPKTNIRLKFPGLKRKFPENLDLKLIKSSPNFIFDFNFENNKTIYEFQKTIQNINYNIIKINSKIKKEECKTIFKICKNEYITNKNNFNSGNIRNIAMSLKTIFLKEYLILVSDIGNYDTIFNCSSSKYEVSIVFNLDDKQFLIAVY